MSDSPLNSPKFRADLDQSMAMIADTFPPLWRRLYFNMTCEGFTEDQAMRLLIAYISSQGTGNKLPTPPG